MPAIVADSVVWSPCCSPCVCGVLLRHIAVALRLRWLLLTFGVLTAGGCWLRGTVAVCHVGLAWRLCVSRRPFNQNHQHNSSDKLLLCSECAHACRHGNAQSCVLLQAVSCYICLMTDSRQDSRVLVGATAFPKPVTSYPEPASGPGQSVNRKCPGAFAKKLHTGPTLKKRPRHTATLKAHNLAADTATCDPHELQQCLLTGC
jgi:hypothetical protein